jgi:hypothetical protein
VAVRSEFRPVLLACVAAALLVTAVANAAGYRFGVSDQEFYIPAIYLALDPSLFPHDRAMFEAQDTMLAFDEVVAAVTRWTGIGLPLMFLAGYIAALLAMFAGAWLIGRHFYASPWTAGALAAALTLRHQIPGTGVNTFEGYLHPRMLAFGAGALAVALFLRGRLRATLILVLIAAVIHPTTAAWFAMWLGAATIASRRTSTHTIASLAAGALAAALLLAWLAIERGAQPMDPSWTDAAARRYLYPDAWPVWTWVAHAAIVGIAVFAYRRRVAAGLAQPAERAVFTGGLALLAFLLLAVAFVAARVPLAVQLQPARVLWIWDFLATIYVVWLAAERPGATSPIRARAVFAAVALVACARGAFIMGWEFPERRLVRVGLPEGEWGRVMAWASTTPAGSNFLTDPGHAWRYGVSVRIAARRDVYLEAAKDPALASYSRDTAARVAERQRDLGDFGRLDAEQARRLDRRYDLDYLIAEHRIDLPVVREFGAFKVYSLRDR